MTDRTLTEDEKADIHTDSDLIKRWLYAQRPARIRGMYLWSKVGYTFGIGSTSAQQICRRHDFDPDLMVKRQ